MLSGSNTSVPGLCMCYLVLIPQVAVSLSVLIPVYLGYVGVAFWFFWRAVMETALLLFTKVKVRQYVSDIMYNYV